MSDKRFFYLSSLLILPFLFVIFYVIRLFTAGLPIEDSLPGWYTLSIIFTMIVLERIYKYKKEVSQRSLLLRDILSTFVNLYVTGLVAGIIFLPILAFFPELFFDRSLFFARSDQLGPLWLQAVSVLLLVSFSRYWIHRLQHKYNFLWKLHSYHHRVTDLQASNLLVSHPIDYALRNVFIFVLLSLIGFNLFAILIGASIFRVGASFSHCGADVKAGFLNYFFVTPEVHRWHHSAKVPAGHQYSVNYGVGLVIWDILFGTFYLPSKDGVPEQPEHIGHPNGLPDESNYLKLLLEPLGFKISKG